MSTLRPEVAPATRDLAFRRARMSAVQRRRETWVAYGLMAPAVVLIALVMAYPVAWEVWVSLTSFSVREEGRAFVGLANYRAMVGDPAFRYALAVTVVYFAITTAAKLALGLGMALLLARPSRLRAVGFPAGFPAGAYPGGGSVVGRDWNLDPPPPT